MNLSLAFDKFWFLNFVNINTEKFAGINFVIAVTEILTFWYFYSEIYVSLIKWNIVFLQIYKDIWIQLKTIIIVAVSITFTVTDFFIIISILNIIAELTVSNKLTLIPSFICLLIAKVYMGKLE